MNALPPDDTDADEDDPFGAAIARQRAAEAKDQTLHSFKSEVERLARRGMLPKGISKQLGRAQISILEILRDLPPDARAEICTAWIDRLYEGARL